MALSLSTTPRTLPDLQAALRLPTEAAATALVGEDAVKEAFRRYANLCLSAGLPGQAVPTGRAVQRYLTGRAVEGRGAAALDGAVAADCHARPYDVLPHAARFVLAAALFLNTPSGRPYDVGPPAAHPPPDADLDRCDRLVRLLGFLAQQNRENRDRLKRLRAERLARGRGAAES
ncbi:hypothetical protein GGS23DRAFT_595674 [Durotheca rogersii]|uniref:uncharacterized protein n=1 Tax=Durotheca rogersii TaxID=419775 RepID=UPI00221EC147|nr:uncharacterized protein GGS23DRAFT_595674 [Durotheca rogersii]KAI5864022.1 hypothetical protein GGS23DRAFT_595674 [Durotheca rogersii]